MIEKLKKISAGFSPGYFRWGVRIYISDLPSVSTHGGQMQALQGSIGFSFLAEYKISVQFSGRLAQTTFLHKHNLRSLFKNTQFYIIIQLNNLSSMYLLITYQSLVGIV